MITIYHLDRSRSERAVWLMEELSAAYEIEHFDRTATWEAAPDYKTLHPLGSSPVISVDGKVIAESGAVIEYLATTVGSGVLALSPGHSRYADYLYWFHFAECTLMNILTSEIMSERAGVDEQHASRIYNRRRRDELLAFVDDHLASNRFIAGDDFTAADIMITFPFTTTRAFAPFKIDAYPNIVAYLARIRSRPAYRRGQHIAGPNRDRTESQDE